MQLLASDDLDLRAKGYDFEATAQGAELHITIHGFPLPATYSERAVDLLVKVPAGYPNAKLDMFWTIPRVTLANGQDPKAATVVETYGGRRWQRWSRHWPTWRPGTDCVGTFLASIRNELSKGV